MFKKHIFEIMWLKINDKSNIQLSSGQVIRDCVLVVVYIGNPIIGTSVLYVEQVENIQSEPNVLEIAEESAIHDCIRSPGKLVGETEVHAFVGRSTEIAVLVACTWAVTEAAGQYAFQIQFGHVCIRGNNPEKERDIITLAVRHRYIFAPSDALLRFH